MAERSRRTLGVAALLAGAKEAGLGLRDGEVDVVAHDSRWAALFADLASDIAATLEVDVSNVQHVGSTAVAGLSAKPVLDVAAGVPAEYDKGEIERRLTSIGANFRGDLGVYGGLLFTIEPKPGLVVSHIHVVEIDDFQWRWYLQFRDALRRDQTLAGTYEARKKAAAADNPRNRPGYTAAKSEWVLSTVMDLDHFPNPR